MTSWRAELAATTALAGPVILSQVGLVTLGVVDTALMGRVSEEGLAAVALGHSYVWNVMIFAMGTLFVLDPWVAQAVGARRDEAVGGYVQTGLVLAAVLSLVSAALAIPAESVLLWLGQPASVCGDAAAYVHWSIPGILPMLAFVVFRQTVQAYSITRPVVITVLLVNVANAGLDWLLIFGAGPIPPLGAAGCAMASSLCRWGLAAGLLLLAWPRLRQHLWPIRPRALELRSQLVMLKAGAPIGAAHALEFGAFAGALALMGLLGEQEIAAHQVAISLASFSFMFPLGVSSAAAVRVGYAIGRVDRVGATRAATVALALGTAVMCVSMIAFLCWPTAFAGLYTDQAGVLLLAASLIPLAGIFQIVDGVQVVAGGILRGCGDTRSPFVVHLFAFWCVGLPLGWFLGFRRGFGADGVWWGLVVGLLLAALVLTWRVVRALRPT